MFFITKQTTLKMPPKLLDISFVTKGNENVGWIQGVTKWNDDSGWIQCFTYLVSGVNQGNAGVVWV